MRNHKEKSVRLKTTTRHLASHLRGGANLSSSWLLWGGVGREAGTSTVLEGWFKLRSSSPFSFRADTPFTEVETGRRDQLLLSCSCQVSTYLRPHCHSCTG